MSLQAAGGRVATHAGIDDARSDTPLTQQLGGAVGKWRRTGQTEPGRQGVAEKNHQRVIGRAGLRSRDATGVDLDRRFAAGCGTEQQQERYP